MRQLIKSTQGDSFYKDIIDTVREPFLALDSNLRVLAANRSFYRTFKVTSRETIGHLIYDLGNRQWDIPKLRTLLEEIIPKHNLFNDYQIEHEFPIIGKRIMLLNARQITQPQEMQQLILLAIEDVTDRTRKEQDLQASEERFRRTFETAKDCILLIDRTSGLIVNSNQAAQDLLGYSLKQINKCTLWEFGFIKDVGEFKKTAVQMEDKGFIDYIDTSIKTRDGREIAADVFLIEKEKVIQCILHDITERKKTDEQLKITLKDLKNSNKELEQFVFVAFHDLQEPLRMVASYTQLLEKRYKDKLDGDALEFINYAVAGAIRM